MEKDDNNYSGGFLGVDFNDHEHEHDKDDDHHNHLHQNHQQQLMVNNTHENGNQMVDYLLNNPIQHLASGGFCGSNSLDKLSFADVMQFADLGQKLALNKNKTCHDHDEYQESGIDPVYALKFPVLNDRIQEEDHQFIGEDVHKTLVAEGKNKKKRPRTVKTREEVESQRMNHIAVERNRRKQVNEHLRVLRSLMPGSYAQRGDQASIVGGAIEFVRELEQLLQCLESQKLRRLYGDTPTTALPIMQQAQPGLAVALFYPPPDDQMKLVEYDGGLKEEVAECKSCVADVEVRLLGFDGMIKILCRRTPGQLIKTIAALEDLQFGILHTNITTIEQTVLYSFNVKVASEAMLSAEEIANSVQQIIGLVHANNT